MQTPPVTHDGSRREARRDRARKLLILAAVAAAAIFVTFVFLGLKASPDLEGLGTGLLRAVIATLAFSGAAAWFLMVYVIGNEPPPVDPAEARELETLLGPTLTELAQVRADVIREVKTRSRIWVPAGMAATSGLWLLLQLGSDPADLFDLVCMAAGGGVIGAALAADKPRRMYRAL